MGQRISVVMATRNGTPFLRPQLDSIVGQARPPDELIVVDDASHDGTPDMVDGATRGWPLPVTVMRSPRRGGSTVAFGAGIAEARGDLVVLCDQDDVWLPHKLATLEAALAAAPRCGMAFSDAWLLDATGRRRDERLWAVAGFSPHQQAAMRREPFGQILSRSIVSGCTLAVRSSLRPLILPFPARSDLPLGAMTHDRWISLVASAAGDVAVIDQPLIGYRIHREQQIGIPALQVRLLVPSSVLRWRQLAVPREQSQARLDHALVHLAELRRRLVATGIGGPRALERVDRAVEHLCQRRALAGRATQRVRPVLGQLATGAYHRYSLGLASAAADLVRR